MSRLGKIAAASAVGGLLAAIAIVSAVQPPPIPVQGPPPSQDVLMTDPLRAELRRCRTITMPDSGCDAVWDAQRRRFFKQQDTDT